jgi:hypothetical protein
MSTKVNVKALLVTPQECLEGIDRVRKKMNLSVLEDRKTKDAQQMGEFYHACRYLQFPTNSKGMIIDGDGIPSLEGIDPQALYHSEKSLFEMGATMVMKTGYPSPDGNDLYPDQKTWETAQAMTRIKGRLLPGMNALAWEQLETLKPQKFRV